jgi:lysyl-tRNA synthetase, class II
VTTASTSGRTGAPPETDEVTSGRLGQAWTSYLRRSPRLLGALTGLFGLLSLVHAFLGEHTPQVIMRFAPVSAAEAATAVTAGAGLLLLRLSGGLRRGQKRAWRAAVVVLTVVVVAHVLRGIDVGALIISVVLLSLLLASRRQFQAKADVTSRWLAVRSFVQMFLGAVLYGLAMLYIDVHTRVQGHPSFWVRLQEIVEGMVGVDGPAHLSGRAVDDLLGAAPDAPARGAVGG